MNWWYVLAVIVGLIALGWLGLRVQPASFPSYTVAAPALQSISLPTNLPAPVERYYRKLYGDQIPLITSAKRQASRRQV